MCVLLSSRAAQVERDRGITVKAQTASMVHDGHLLNLIDTPGHVDFSYEVKMKWGHLLPQVCLWSAGVVGREVIAN